jgi:ribosomal protein S18 acetylase RimI-like enzyme
MRNIIQAADEWQMLNPSRCPPPTVLGIMNVASEPREPGLVHGISRRAARGEDYLFALALYLESTRPLLTALGTWDEVQVLRRFSEGFHLPEVTMLSAAGADIGWMQVSEPASTCIHLDQLHLVERVRNEGIGTHLIRELQQRALESARRVELNVMRGNPAQALYERLGFRVVEGDEERLHMRWDPKEAP